MRVPLPRRGSRRAAVAVRSVDENIGGAALLAPPRSKEVGSPVWTTFASGSSVRLLERRGPTEIGRRLTLLGGLGGDRPSSGRRAPVPRRAFRHADGCGDEPCPASTSKSAACRTAPTFWRPAPTPDNVLQEANGRNNCTAVYVQLSGLTTSSPSAQIIGPGPRCAK